MSAILHISESITSDCDILQQIDAMSDAEIDQYQKLIIYDLKHYNALQIEWLNEERYLLGCELQHSPNELELIYSPHRMKNSRRFRVFYCLKFPDKVF